MILAKKSQRNQIVYVPEFARVYVCHRMYIGQNRIEFAMSMSTLSLLDPQTARSKFPKCQKIKSNFILFPNRNLISLIQFNKILILIIEE